MVRTRSRLRIVSYIALTIALSTAALVTMVLLVDIYLHHRAERYAGVNVWGYRGPRVSRKAAGERRIAVVGGSTAFGYGVNADEAFPAALEALLKPAVRPGASVSVVNLGMNAEGAYAFRFNLEDYAYLNYDLAILYEGYNDLGDARNVWVGRRTSPIFRLTGYYPIFPLVFSEKAMALAWGNDLNAAYASSNPKKTVFRPSLASRTSAATLNAAVAVSQAFDRQLDALAKADDATTSTARVYTRSDLGCPPRWAAYCTSQFDAVKYLLDRGRSAIVVTQPYANDRHRSQQEALRQMLQAQFPQNPHLRYVDLGSVLDKQGKDREMFYDGVHLVAAGNRIIASHLVTPVTELLSDAFVSGTPR